MCTERFLITDIGDCLNLGHEVSGIPSSSVEFVTLEESPFCLFGDAPDVDVVGADSYPKELTGKGRKVLII